MRASAPGPAPSGPTTYGQASPRTNPPSADAGDTGPQPASDRVLQRGQRRTAERQQEQREVARAGEAPRIDVAASARADHDVGPRCEERQHEPDRSDEHDDVGRLLDPLAIDPWHCDPAMRPGVAARLQLRHPRRPQQPDPRLAAGSERAVDRRARLSREAAAVRPRAGAGGGAGSTGDGTYAPRASGGGDSGVSGSDSAAVDASAVDHGLRTTAAGASVAGSSPTGSTASGGTASSGAASHPSSATAAHPRRPRRAAPAGQARAGQSSRPARPGPVRPRQARSDPAARRVGVDVPPFESVTTAFARSSRRRALCPRRSLRRGRRHHGHADRDAVGDARPGPPRSAGTTGARTGRNRRRTDRRAIRLTIDHLVPRP